MTTKVRKTDRQRLHNDGPGSQLLDWSIFADGREDDFRNGLEAFAHEWFREFKDEQNLPREFVALAELASEHFGWDLDELLGNDDDEEDDDES